MHRKVAPRKVPNGNALYRRGKACDDAKNYEEAALWYEEAVKFRHPAAMNNLGMLYEQGKGVAKNDQVAARLYQQSANAGYVPGMHHLACCFSDGTGVKRDDKAAVHWFERAVARNCAVSMTGLAILYMKGQGVNQDMNKAVELLNEAARRGEPNAKLTLQEMKKPRMTIGWKWGPAPTSPDRLRFMRGTMMRNAKEYNHWR
jgi:TPR repeat protein